MMFAPANEVNADMRLLNATALAAFYLTGCSVTGGQGAAYAPIRAEMTAPAPRATVPPNLFILYQESNTVGVYSHTGKVLIRSITDGIHGPDAMAVDSQGTAYVGNFMHGSGGAVKVYPPGASSPSTTIDAPGRQVLACDPSGNLYVGTDRARNVKVYGEQGRTLLRTIDGVRDPAAFAFDGSENLYVATQEGVSVYAAGGTKLLRSLSVAEASALAFDSTGELYVLGHPPSGGGFVDAFAPGAQTPERTITDGLQYPNALAVDDHDNLYVANCGYCFPSNPGNVTVYAKGKTSLLRTIDRGIAGPNAIAFSPPDLYVANRQSAAVRMYRHGKPRVLRSIAPPPGYGLPVAFGFGP